jgi:hypothetical protein
MASLRRDLEEAKKARPIEQRIQFETRSQEEMRAIRQDITKGKHMKKTL